MKIGTKLYSPTIPLGSAKLLVGLEQNETLRYIPFLEPGGTVVTSTTVLFPISWKKDKSAADRARKNIVENLKKYEAEIYMIDAEKLAWEAGLALAQNVVILGALSQVKEFPLKEEELVEALKIRVPSKYLEPNLKAFELGANYIKKNYK